MLIKCFFENSKQIEYHRGSIHRKKKKKLCTKSHPALASMSSQWNTNIIADVKKYYMDFIITILIMKNLMNTLHLPDTCGCTGNSMYRLLPLIVSYLITQCQHSRS